MINHKEYNFNTIFLNHAYKFNFQIPCALKTAINHFFTKYGCKSIILNHVSNFINMRIIIMLFIIQVITINFGLFNERFYVAMIIIYLILTHLQNIDSFN